MPNVLQPSLSNTPTSKTFVENATVAPYATNLLQRGQAFTTAETPVYEGQLTTGPSQYQNQAWQGLANLTVPQNITAAGNQLGNISTQQQNLAYDPTKFTAGTFGTAEAQKYMNPYIQAALDPQMEYQRRQAAINQQGDMAKLSQVGAFGGSRQAILQGQNQEALGRLQATTAGAGYEKAYKSATDQYNEDMRRDMEAQKAAEASKQFGATYKQTGLSNAASSEQSRADVGGKEATYGLQNLKALSEAGGTQRDIDQQALDASYKDWLRQTEYPGKQLEQMKGFITAMAPVTPETKTVYGQKEKAASTAAGLFGAAASALGIKTLDDLTKKASEYGLTVANFKKMLGIPENATGSVRNETDLSKLTPEELQRLHEQENPGGGGGGGGATEPVGLTDEVDPILPPEGDEGDYGGYGEGYSAAQGGLVDLLHKMRSHK
jgi:hypothetical protein